VTPPGNRVGIGVIGVGFMGQTHVRAYAAAAAAGAPCELVAVCDASPERIAGVAAAAGNLGDASEADGTRQFDPSRVRGYTSPDALLDDPRVDAVSICTYTDTHVDLAARALRAGKHVLVEKPVAVHAADVRRLEAEAAASGRLCMPAMCMRFWPGWPWLRERIRAGEWGPLCSLTLQRLGSGPRWGRDFYSDTARSGGALVDLHIHDVDFICWCLGPPRSVRAHGSVNHVLTAYRYSGPDAAVDGERPLVTAEGGWTLQPSAGFRMRYLAAFERATIDFDLSRTPQVKVHVGDGTEEPEMPGIGGYEAEVSAFIAAVARKHAAPHAAAESGLPTLAEAVQVAQVLETELESLRTGREVEV
jgi:predicted dehydrogenase